MKLFTDWLNQAFATLSPTDPFHQERLLAFHKLSCQDLIANQKENYSFLQELLEQLTRQAYVRKETMDFWVVPSTSSAYGSVAAILTFVNGIWSPTQSHFSTHGQGIQLRRWADLPPLAQQAAMNAYKADLASADDIFILLNTLLFQESYLLQIEDHVSIEDIIVIQHIITDSIAHVVPRLFLTVGKSSRVTIVEQGNNTSHVSSFTNHLTHINLASEAQLSYYRLSDTPFYQVNTLYCNQKADSLLTHYTFSLDKAKLRTQLITQLNGSHATAQLYGLYVLSREEKVDYRIQVAHRYPHSLSKQHYKGIMGDRSTAAFQGTIYVAPEAQRTNAYQTNNAMVVSPLAHHYVKPQLEIYADDVKCSHGATAGQLDPTQLFYLQSRGIDAALAKRLLLEAFGREIMDTVPITTLKDYIETKLLAKLVRL